MLNQSSITPIVPVADLERARKYYRDVLGLKEQGTTTSGNVQIAADGSRLELMLKPQAVSRDATLFSFEVNDIDGEVKALARRGARFEEVDVPGATRSGVISTMGDERAAWFKDSEGNWLCLHQRRH
jgi:catechol 2,3-dioxygenase-like lactoylglutathione lyase family enzyme